VLDEVSEHNNSGVSLKKNIYLITGLHFRQVDPYEVGPGCGGATRPLPKDGGDSAEAQTGSGHAPRSEPEIKDVRSGSKDGAL